MRTVLLALVILPETKVNGFLVAIAASRILFVELFEHLTVCQYRESNHHLRNRLLGGPPNVPYGPTDGGLHFVCRIQPPLFELGPNLLVAVDDESPLFHLVTSSVLAPHSPAARPR